VFFHEITLKIIIIHHFSRIFPNPYYTAPAALGQGHLAHSGKLGGENKGKNKGNNSGNDNGNINGTMPWRIIYWHF
jgi:hypothetical protein